MKYDIGTTARGCQVVATDDTAQAPKPIAPGSVVVVRDEEWLVTRTEPASDGTFVHVQGLGELVRESTAIFSDAIDDIEPLDPAVRKLSATTHPRTGVRSFGLRRCYASRRSHCTTRR